MPKQNSKPRKWSKRSDRKGNYAKKNNDAYKHDSGDSADEKLTGSNDFRWYNLNPDLVAKASRVPFGRPLGNSITTSYAQVSNTIGPVTNENYFIPGIAAFRMIPGIGCNARSVQSIDVAAKSIYSWVRHANSGHTNYDSPDLMIYLLAAANIYAAAGYLLKAYSCLNTYNPTNRYMPRTVLSSMGFDPDVLVENLADFRYFCGQWFKKAQVIFTPKKFPLFEKAFWMYTQIFEEDKTGKSPYYHYVPIGFYKFNPTKYTTGGCLEFKDTASAYFNTWSGVKNYFTDLLDAIIDDEDMGIMSGDIKKAFGDNVWTLGDFPFDSEMKVVRDSFVLQQMHNATPLNIDTTKIDIVQDVPGTNRLLWFPEVKIDGSTTHTVNVYNIRNTSAILDIDSAVPTEEEVIEATQYLNFITPVTSASGYTRYTSYLSITGYTHAANSYVLENASDFTCVGLFIYEINAGGGYSTIDYKLGSWWDIFDGALPRNFVYARLCRMRTFEWLPEIKCDTGIPYISLHNYTLITDDVISNLHDCSWLSLLAIPANEHLK